jgi:hypothetical protein
MTDDQEELLALDRATFAAEAHEPKTDWQGVLHRSLGEDFRLRRAIGELEDRERMIARLTSTEPEPREILDEPQVAVLGDIGLVCSRVQFGGALFQNAKVFEKTADGWRCMYWRVTRVAASSDGR